MKRKRVWLGGIAFLVLVLGPSFAAEARYYHPTMGRWIQRDPTEYTDGRNLLQYSRSLPTSGSDPSGLLCKFTIFVDAPGYKDYEKLEELLKSISSKKKDEGKMGTGHTWVRLEEDGKETLEGGHTGENKDAGLNSEITDTDFLTFSGGLFKLLKMNGEGDFTSPMPSIPEADPHNPLRWLKYQYKDGRWQDGHGKHTPAVQKTWCLGDTECAAVRNKIIGFRSNIKTFGIDNNCTSTAADIAQAGGITLDPYVSYDVPQNFLQAHSELIPPIVGVIAPGILRANVWESSSYASVRFALTQKMADILKPMTDSGARK